MKKFFLTLLSTAVCLTACNTETNEPAGPSANKINISPSITLTRATEMNFEEGDRIGLTIIRADESLHAENALLAHNGDVFTGNTFWYTETNEESHLVAYHPYDESGAPTAFTVALDQSGDGYGKSDLMGASQPNVAPSGSAVGMTFYHLLTKLTVNVTNESSADVASVVFQGSIPTANVDFITHTVVADDAVAPANITAQKVTKNELYRAIIIPQQVALTIVVTTSNGKTLSKPLAVATLVQKGQYSVNVTISADEELEATISGEIEGWSDEGDIGPAEEGPGESLYTITFEGTEWAPYVAAAVAPGAPDTHSVCSHDGDYSYPLWVDATTRLTTVYPFGPEDMMGMGYDYPLIVSSYNSNDLGAYSGYDTDLYVYNPVNANSTTGGGNNGSDNFLIGFGYSDGSPFSMGDMRPTLKFADGTAHIIESVYINSTTYFLNSVKNGDGFTSPLSPSDPDIMLIATGYDRDGNQVGEKTMIYATSEMQIESWTKWDLSDLGAVVEVKFNMTGGPDNGLGFSAPAYYAIDDITVVIGE